MRRLVLWDIDGTLVDSAGLGREAFADAFESLFGRGCSQMVPMAGRTDAEIAHDLLESNGVTEGERDLVGFTRALEEALAAKAELIGRRGRSYPGAREAVARLAREPGVVQSLLTGNLEPNAAVKLAPFGLLEHLDLAIGGYGSDHAARFELVAIARSKAEAKHGIRFDAAHTVLIGDTPLDVAAAREAGARVVAVASGPYGVAELEDAGADAVLPDLVDVEAVARAVTVDAGASAARERA